MRTGYILLFLYWCISSTTSFYTKQDSFVGSSFYDAFVWDTMDDPTHGRVNYVDLTYAQEKNLTSVVGSKFFMRADSTSVVTAGSRGRDSIRIHSLKAYDDAVFILDLSHMPEGCATWPAWWTLSQKGPWPIGGEIDIIEGVNLQTSNLASLHTTQNCTMTMNPHLLGVIPAQEGQTRSTDCDAYDDSNQGCGVSFSDAESLFGTKESYGKRFNQLGGGWFVMQKSQDAGIRVWFWQRTDQSVPFEILTSSNELLGPVSWGAPEAWFQTGENCNYVGHFNEHEIVFDLTLCGDWAGSDFSNTKCSLMSCADFVDTTPSAFVNAYWEINSLSVYTGEA